MKIAVTGHTSGIGLAIYNHFLDKGHVVLGFSKTNGYDLLDDTRRTQMYDQLVQEDCDCLINNAYPYTQSWGTNGFLQCAILNDMWMRWRGNSTKIIITVGSLGADHDKNHFHPYAIHKRAIDDTARQLRMANSSPQVTVVKPGYVNTRIVQKIVDKKCQPQQIAEIIEQILCSPVKILDITFEAR